MTIIDKLKALVEPQAEPNSPDETWPKEETPGYYDDTSLGTYTMPPTAVVDEQWEPTADREMPGYRGVEEHGVPYNAASGGGYLIPKTQEEMQANREADEKAKAETVTVTEETILPVIPVNVVSMPEPIGRQNRLSINSFPITALADPIRIAPASHRREQLMISVLGADVIMFHTDQQAAKMNGYPVTAGKGDVEIVTTDAVYAYSVAGGTVYVLESYSTEVNEHTV